MAKRLRVKIFERFINQKGQVNVIRKGVKPSWWSDLYHWLLVLPWWGFFSLIVILYLISNAGFAFLYLAGGDSIANAQPGSFRDAFFFSVQTLATIGYGAMYPQTFYAHTVVALEALCGLLGVALVTGLAFARFSRPSARIIFSRVVAIAPYNGILMLMFRAANQRYNQILEAQVRLTLVRNEVTLEGETMRRFYELPLLRSQTPLFALTWTIMHPLDHSSPLFAATPVSLAEQSAELLVTFTGLDETVSQTIHARYSYLPHEILWNVRFVDILGRTEDGKRTVDYTKFHDVEPLKQN